MVEKTCSQKLWCYKRSDDFRACAKPTHKYHKAQTEEHLLIVRHGASHNPLDPTEVHSWVGGVADPAVV